jgi:hypothetical protein
MKSFLAAAVMIPAMVLANPPAPETQMATYQTVCVSGRDLVTLVGEFQEIPYVRGVSRGIVTEGASLSMVIYVNAKTGTFTIVERAAADTYCLLAVGAGFEPVPRAIQEEVERLQQQGRL